jgi:predicted flap endonuclease-1-like 5' DNA nuclease
MVLLIAVAVAFPTGWLVCRAWLNARGEVTGNALPEAAHNQLLLAQRSRYRGQVQKVVEVVRRHEAARDKLMARLAAAGDRLESSQQKSSQLQTRLTAALEELEQLRDGAEQPAERAVQPERSDPVEEELAEAGNARDTETVREIEMLQSERDKLFARVRRLEEEARAVSITRTAEAEQRAERGELREKLATAEHKCHELETRLTERETRLEELEQAVTAWKHRVMPLTRQVQTYRDAIKKLQEGEATAAPAGDLRADALQEIRGIGPALERRLNANGIMTFAQIAALDPLELASLADKLAISPTLPERDRWIEQAREFAESMDAQTTDV